MCVVSFIILQAEAAAQSVALAAFAFVSILAQGRVRPNTAAFFTFAQAIPCRFWQRPLLNSILALGYLLAAFAFRCYPEYGHFSQPSLTQLPTVPSHTIARSPLTHSRWQFPHTQLLSWAPPRYWVLVIFLTAPRRRGRRGGKRDPVTGHPTDERKGACIHLALVEDTFPSHTHRRSSRYMSPSIGSGTEVLLGLPYMITKALPTLPYRPTLCSRQGYMW